MEGKSLDLDVSIVSSGDARAVELSDKGSNRAAHRGVQRCEVAQHGLDANCLKQDRWL